MGIYEYAVEQSDVDARGRIKITGVLDKILRTAQTDAERSGFGVDVLHERNCSWVLSRMAVNLTRLPECYDTVRVDTWISPCERLFSVRNFALTDKSGNSIGSGISLWAMIDLASRRPQNIEEFQQSLGLRYDRPEIMERPLKIGTVADECEESYKVRYSDTDFNGHLNSIRSVEHLLDMCPYDELLEFGGCRLDLNFSREGHIGETVVLRREGSNPYLFEIASADGLTLTKARLELKTK